MQTKIALNNFPTNSFTILEPRDQEIGEFYVVRERPATVCDVSEL